MCVNREKSNNHDISMNHEEIIKKKIGKEHGFKAPEGFLEPTYKHVCENLPERKPVEIPRRTVWQTIRPYVYLAAMFMGLWCTMKIVSSMQISRQEKVSLDNPPALVAQAVATPEVEARLNLAQQANDIAIVSDAVASYNSIEEFEEAFDYQFTDQVEEIDVKALQRELAADDASGEGDDDFDEDFYYNYYASL